MILDDKTLPPFEPILNRLYELAQRNGISELEKKGYGQIDFESNPSVRRLFLRASHYGEMEGDLRQLTTELKELRRKRDPDASAVENRALVIENRQLVLRRLADSILFAMIQQQNWLLRRFTRGLGIHKIDPIVLARTIREAVERNTADRLKFNLVFDLSTVVQIGDLIEVDMSAQGAGKWKVIELKEGKINNVLSGLLGAREIDWRRIHDRDANPW